MPTRLQETPWIIYLPAGHTAEIKKLLIVNLKDKN
jgi:hypothetical protein